MKFKLAIIIPTRNRLDNLLKLVSRIERAKKNYGSDIKLVIFDNNSSEYDELMLSSEIDEIYNGKLEIHRSLSNIGGDANIMKTFSESEAEWILPLGDSKLLTNESIQIIFDCIYKYKNANFINFYFPDITHGYRTNTISIYTESMFINHIESLGNILLLGNTIFNTKNINKVLKSGFEHIYSCASQTAIMIKLSSLGQCVLSKEIIIESMMHKPINAELHLPLDYWNRIPSLINCVDLYRDKIKFHKIISGIGYPSSALWWLVYSTILECQNNRNKQEIIFKYKRAILNRYILVSKARVIILYYLPTIVLSIPYNKMMLSILRILKRKIYINSSARLNN
jgi:hypothetical protein